MSKFNWSLNFFKKENKYDFIFLSVLFVLAIFLRFYLIPDNLFFGPEQGIDFTVIKNIAINHKLTLIGAKTDISGVFHGPLYYYIAVIPFILTTGNPVAVSFFFVFLNSITVYILYYLGRLVYDRKTGILAALFFCFSYGSIVYSRWLSSHPLTFPLSTLFFILFIRFINGKKYSLIGVAVIFALLGQSEFLNFIFFTVIILFLIFLYRKYFLKYSIVYLLSVVLLLILFSTINFAIFDLRHEFLITKSLWKLTNGTSGYYISFLNSFIISFKIFITSVREFIFPGSSVIAVLFISLGVIMIYFEKIANKGLNKVLLIWLLIPVSILTILRHDVLQQFYVAIAPVVILIVARLTVKLFKFNSKAALLVFLLIITGNIYYWFFNIPKNTNIFFQSTQLGLKYRDQIMAIDYIFKTAGKQTFSFQAYTIPYWMQQGWEFLFWHYGENKFGVKPVKDKANLLFVIVQDDPSNKKFQEDWLKNSVSKWGEVVDEKRFGVLNIKRLIIK